MLNKEQKIKLKKTKNFFVSFNPDYKRFLMKWVVSKYKGLMISAQLFRSAIDAGYLALGMSLSYSFGKIDHAGIEIILSLLLFEISIEFCDNRHSEDYED